LGVAGNIGVGPIGGIGAGIVAAVKERAVASVRAEARWDRAILLRRVGLGGSGAVSSVGLTDGEIRRLVLGGRRLEGRLR
jgi:hypothetical protein